MNAPDDGTAQLPPGGIEGLDPAWSRLVHVPVTDGVGRTWHVLDNQAPQPELTLLCVHGNPSWSYLYRNLMARAPAGTRVIAVDQLEMGFSERSGGLRRLATRVDDLCELTDEMAIEGPVVTVAHDWGGPISLGWAERHLDRLAGVVLMNTAVHQPAGSPAPSLIRIVRSKPLLENMTVASTGFIRGALDLSRPRPPAPVREGFLAPYRSAARRKAIGEFVADIPLSPDHPSAAALDRIAGGLADLAETPVLLLWGARDLVFSDLYLHDLERRLPHADVHRYPDASHFVSEDVDAVGAIVDWTGALGVEPPARTPAGPPRRRVSTLAETHGDLGAKLAVAEMTEGSAGVDFAEFDRLVQSTAAGLDLAAVRTGDRVALMVPPGIDLAVALYACWRIGAVIVLIDSGLGPRGMQAAMKAAAPDHLIGIPKALVAARGLRWPGRRISTTPLAGAPRRLLGVVDDLESLRVPGGTFSAVADAADLAAVVFTSGSTGPSKGVVYTHAQLEAQRNALLGLYDISTDDRLVAAFAPFALYGPAMGITSVVPDMDVAAPGTLTASALGDAAVRAEATMVFASPAALANVVRTAGELSVAHRAAFEQVRIVLSAGAPVRAGLLRAATGLFPNATAHTPYGMTECLPVASISLDGIDAATDGDGVCVGAPVAGVDVRIRPLGHDGRPAGELTDRPGVLGEIVVRAAHARNGYDRLWHTDFAASQPPGWHASGDIGRLDDSGRLWVGGRLAHVITTEDGPVAPVGIEQAVESVERVASAAAVGVGPVGAQQVVVVVVTADPGRAPRLAAIGLVDAVRAAVGDHVAAVFEVPALPVDRRHNSKIDRARVAGWAGAALAGGRLSKL